MRLRYFFAGCLVFLIGCLDPNPSIELDRNNPWIPYSPPTANSADGDQIPEPGAKNNADPKCSETPLTDWSCLQLPAGLPPMAAQWSGPVKGFATLCAKCHGSDGRGTELGKQLGAKDLASDEIQAFSDEKLADAIMKGSRNQKMPAFEDSIGANLVQDLVKHVRTLPTKKSPF